MGPNNSFSKGDGLIPFVYEVKLFVEPALIYQKEILKITARCILKKDSFHL